MFRSRSHPVYLGQLKTRRVIDGHMGTWAEHYGYVPPDKPFLGSALCTLPLLSLYRCNIFGLSEAGVVQLCSGTPTLTA